MAGPEQQGFEVAPIRIGGSGDEPGRPRRGRPPVILVVIVALAIPGLAIVGPRIEWRPEIDLSAIVPTPTPEPTRTPRPRPTPSPTATPLPDITIADGALPREPIPVNVGSFRLFDASSGELGQRTNLRLGEDAVFADPGGGWTCVCFDRGFTDPSETVTVSIRRLGPDLNEEMRAEIGTYYSEAPRPGPDFGGRFDLERSPDGRFAFLLVGERSRETGSWRIAIEALDLQVGTLLSTTELGVVGAPPNPGDGSSPAPDMTFESYLNGPYLRLSPDGGRLVVHGSVETFDPSTSTTQSRRFGWLADVTAGDRVPTLSEVRTGGSTWHQALADCGWLGWINEEELAALCWEPLDVSGAQQVRIRAIDVAGRTLVDVPIEMPVEWGFADPVLDLANRTMWLWEPAGHILHRVDLTSGTSSIIDPDPTAPAPVPEPPPATGVAPHWAATISDLNPWNSPTLVFDPGGTRLYAAGMILQPSSAYGYAAGSSGIWVFDAPSFALVDHWPAAAAYSSIGLAGEGRWLVAVGQAGVDTAGNEAGWPMSITIHDTRDGRLSVQLGDLGVEQVRTFP